MSKPGLLEFTTGTEPFAVANGCEHSSFGHFAMTDLRIRVVFQMYLSARIHWLPQTVLYCVTTSPGFVHRLLSRRRVLTQPVKDWAKLSSSLRDAGSCTSDVCVCQLLPLGSVHCPSLARDQTGLRSNLDIALPRQYVLGAMSELKLQRTVLGDSSGAPSSSPPQSWRQSRGVTRHKGHKNELPRLKQRRSSLC